MLLLVTGILLGDTYSCYSSIDNVMQFTIYDMQNILCKIQSVMHDKMDDIAYVGFEPTSMCKDNSLPYELNLTIDMQNLAMGMH